ncbi:helix-turn-helix transcriptional regulator [Haladaptatus sp. CMSO5]|uniref:helix-turn-helix transcriptional regulator n=1 Tax=Haladaptatus sp. CMSO5 TaxID=3120514 RepID=UPI002FCDFAAB
MESALEEIEFLTLSPNRVRILSLLATEPHTRRELVAKTGASQPTLSRILSDFEERNWITRENSDYMATATGRLVANGFGELLSVIETEAKLRPVVRWLPADVLTFDLSHLAEATITMPTQVRPNAPVKRVVTLLQQATDVRIVSYAFNEQSLDVVQKRTGAGDQQFKGVFSKSAIDALADDSQLRMRLEALMATEGVEIRMTDDDLPLAATIADEAVHLFLRDDSGLVQAALDTDDTVVRTWANELFTEQWEAAEPVTLGEH